MFAPITLFAVANTRQLYDRLAAHLRVGASGVLRLGTVHAGRRTPHFAIVALFLMLALLGSITGPAATVFLLLGLFVVVNGALQKDFGGSRCRASCQPLAPRSASSSSRSGLAPSLAGALLLFALGIYPAMVGEISSGCRRAGAADGASRHAGSTGAHR